MSPGAVEAEVARLRAAIARVRLNIEEHVAEMHAPAADDVEAVLAAHILMLDDSRFYDQIKGCIRGQRLHAERAVEEVFRATAERLVVSDDPYLHARAEEIRDLCQSLISALPSGSSNDFRTRAIREPVIFLSLNLSLTAVLRARKMKAAAFVTSSTAYSSHGAILLRTGSIPTLGGVSLPTEALSDETPALVDAVSGEVHLSPSRALRDRILEAAVASFRAAVDPALTPLVACTADGTQVRLAANLDHPSQVALCLRERLSGVGLFRTELMILERGRVPDEDEQVSVYRELIDGLAGRPAVIRTFDLGGDKTAPGLHRCVGPNPALGVRGIRRHLLRLPEELRTQVRAILRAAVGADVGILLPMVTCARDVREALALFPAARAELLARRETLGGNLEVGAMIEVPSAALGIAEILPLVDFVSIGTNDLLQYLTAADRDNPEVAHYQAWESSGLGHLLDHVMATARALGRERDVTVCGEIASDPSGARFLVEHGIRSLSISPGAASGVRDAMATLSLPEDERIGDLSPPP